MINIILFYIITFIYTLLFSYYNALRWIDELDGVYDIKQVKKKWKFIGIFLRILPFSLIYINPPNWKVIFNIITLAMPLFDIGINIFAKKSLFYLGTTNITDKLGKIKWIIYLILIIISFIIIIL